MYKRRPNGGIGPAIFVKNTMGGFEQTIARRTFVYQTGVHDIEANAARISKVAPAAIATETRWSLPDLSPMDAMVAIEQKLMPRAERPRSEEPIL